MVNRIWPTAVAGEADRELMLSASACHIGGLISVKPGQILLFYGNVEVFPVGVVNRFRVPHSVCLKICVLCSGHDNLNTNSNGQTVCNVRSLAAYT